jgi:hypothetical protein
MPLTISHPAAAIPLSRYGLNIQALILGSMVPDLVFFINLNSWRDFSHSIGGLFFFCLPAGLLLLAIYHWLVKEPLFSLLPQWPPIRSTRKTEFRIGTLLITAFSVLIGAATHLIWDSFTHEQGFVIDHLPFLTRTVLDVGFDHIPLTRILHHMGSLFGAIWMMNWIRYRWIECKSQYVNMDMKEKRSRKGLRLAILTTAFLVFGIMYSWLLEEPIKTYDQLRQTMVGGLFATGTITLSFTMVYSLIWQFFLKRNSFQEVTKQRKPESG